MAIQKYPIGQQDFREIRLEQKVYVDKTMYIHKMITSNKYYFLSRPRRFGKSLMVSTLDYLFQGKKELFEGLYIYDKWKFEEYPIIRISFSDIGYREIGLELAIDIKLNSIAEKYGVTFKSTSPSQKFKELIQQLYTAFDKQVVVLIDEYDKPIIDYLDKANLHKAKENRDVMKSFYSILKDADPYLELVFITGISKFSQVSIFSDLNNLYDITLHYAYNESCGISQKELEAYFPKELILYDKEKIKSWYNGYRWDLRGETMYNPFSILNFFGGDGKYLNFWYSTGTPTFLMELSKEMKMYEFEEVEVDFSEMQTFNFENINLLPLLFQTGYLTLKGHNELFNNAILSFPNIEVKESYLRNLVDVYLQSSTNTSKKILTELHKTLLTKDKNKLQETINSAFSHIPYDLWQKDNEHFYHAIVHLLFSLLGVYIQSEVHTKDGRADAIIDIVEGVFCLEFKLDKTAQMAIDQIKANGYLDRYVSGGKKRYAIGINFSSNEKKVEEIIWEEL